MCEWRIPYSKHKISDIELGRKKYFNNILSLVVHLKCWVVLHGNGSKLDVYIGVRLSALWCIYHSLRLPSSILEAQWSYQMFTFKSSTGGNTIVSNSMAKNSLAIHFVRPSILLCVCGKLSSLIRMNKKWISFFFVSNKIQMKHWKWFIFHAMIFRLGSCQRVFIMI